MYQIMDDFNDYHIDEKHKNILLSFGKDKSIELYKNCEKNLIELLLKYNLLTEEFEVLLKKIYSKLYVNKLYF